MTIEEFVSLEKKHLTKFEAYWKSGNPETHPKDMDKSDWLENYNDWLPTD